VPIDRDATLKKAEKLLRQGKLDGAIAEYVRLVEEQPKDWNSINALGDLYVRANQIENAAAQFLRIADHLHAEGFLPRAAAVYKKILKIRPGDEYTLLQLAEIATRQGVFVDAKMYFRQVAERRRAKGDQAGAAEIVMRIGEIDPNDADARVQAARAAQGVGDIGRAARFLIDAADLLEKQKKRPEALTALSEAAALDPEDAGLRARLLTGWLAEGDVAKARTIARTSEELQTVAEHLEHAGLKNEALEVLTEAAQVDPGNVELRARLARECLASGHADQAHAFLNAATAGEDPDLLMTLAQLELQAGRVEEGRAALNRLLAVRPDRRDELVFVATDLADRGQVEAAFACVDLVADAALLEEDWGGAAAALHEFVTRVPNQIPALMKLVEICVDGGLESTMYMAQAQLADAYLATGRAAEARVIAEDLVAREPWLRANIERFRRALLMLGVADPDAVIAERLSGESPFLSTIDLEAPEERPAETVAARQEEVASAAQEPPPWTQEPPPAPDAAPPFASEAPALEIDMPEMLDLPELPPLDVPAPPPPAERHDAGTFDMGEFDLSDALKELRPAAPPQLEAVFGEMRSKAERESQLQNAQAQYAAGIDHANHGRLDEAIASFELASRVPMMRFQAGTRLGRLYIARGDLSHGVEWLERAAQAPAPSAEDGFAVMYELADALERLGESARALAVLLELHADAGDFRDVPQRIDRLSKVQAGG
jgi:tetratricopeptide (TPR) repeat protein